MKKDVNSVSDPKSQVPKNWLYCGAFWIREKEGKQYFNGALFRNKVIAMENIYKKKKSESDYIVYLPMKGKYFEWFGLKADVDYADRYCLTGCCGIMKLRVEMNNRKFPKDGSPPPEGTEKLPDYVILVNCVKNYKTDKIIETHKTRKLKSMGQAAKASKLYDKTRA